MGAGRFSVDTIFGATDRMSGPMAKMESRATRFEKSLGGANKVADIGAGGVTKFAMATVAAGAGVGAVLTNVVQTGMQFEKTLLDAANKFQPGIEKSSETFKKLSAAAQEVGGATEFSSSQAASALNDLAGAGFNADQAISALPKVVDLATASSLDLASAGEIAAKSLGAFGMKSSDPKVLADNLQLVSDALMKADALSSTNIPALFEAIKEGAPIAATAGVKLESFMAMAALLGEKGIEGSVAGTTLKNTMITLSAPTKEAAAAFKKLGVATKTANGELRDPIDTLGDLATATKKMKGAEKVGILEQIFGKIPLAGVSAMLNEVSALEENRKGIKGSAGQIDLVAKSKRSGGTGAWDNFTSGIEAVSLAIFDLIGGPVNDIIDGVTEWIGVNRQLIATNVADYLKAAVPLFQNFADGVKDAFTDAKPLIEGVGGALSGVFGPGVSGSRIQAYNLGNTIAKLGMAFLAFWVVTKAVTAATAVWSFVVGVAKAAMLAYETAVVAVKWAIVWYEIWSKAGTASTLALSASSVIATGSMIAQRAGAFGAAIGVKALAVASWAATLPLLAIAAAIAAVLAAGYQLMAFANENGGLEGIGGALGIGTKDWGFAGVDEVMNRQAKARAKQEAQGGAPAPAAGAAGAFDIAQLKTMATSQGVSLEALTSQLGALDKASGQLPPGMGPTAVEAAGGVPMPGAPGGALTPKDPGVVSLKEDSAAQLSQSMGAAVKGALKGTVTIEIKDKGKNVSSVATDGSDVMSIAPSGDF